MKKQAGFTLIELIAVIVVLGIIAAVAVPRFVNLSTAAEASAARGIASSLTSASSLNYAADIASRAGLDGALDPVSISNCTEVETLLEGGGLPDGYTIEAAAVTAGASAQCNLQRDDATVATFTAIGVDAS